MSVRPTVLVIDDMADNVQVLGDYLSPAYDILYALSGPEALALVAETVPDLILLDVMMPDMDGYAVCDALKSDSRTRAVPIMFVTARNDAESESRALAAGAVDFIHKPVNRDVVRARVGLHLALSARERELRELNADLGARVAERTEALRDALVREEAAHRAKSLFLANVNHELRTPMNAILGWSGLLSSQSDAPRLRERVEKIERAGRQLLSIVDDIVDMAELQAGKVRLELAPFAVSAVLDEAEAAWRGRAEAKGLQWVRDSDDPRLPTALQGDAARLRQLLGNLLGNAVKFSEQGSIALRVRMVEDRGSDLTLRFEVEDQGIGIGVERQADIFKAFEQADNSRTRRFGGTGLGLAICKQLTDLMGGTIGLRSAVGRGSLFWAVLPFSRADGNLGATVKPAPRRPVAKKPDIDLFQLLQIFTPLTHQLAEEDVQAYLTWQRGRDLLDAVLGDRAGDFEAAMKSFDFAKALRCLRFARDTYPQLTGPES